MGTNVSLKLFKLKPSFRLMCFIVDHTVSLCFFKSESDIYLVTIIDLGFAFRLIHV